MASRQMESLNQTLCDLAKYDIKLIIILIDGIRLASHIWDMIYNCLHDVLSITGYFGN